jgi:hypothetical protein
MRITKSLLLALALVLGAQSPAHAQAAPAVMPMQGYLTDEAGAAISGPTTMTFSLYTAETGGTAIYTEDQSVMVDGGYFTAYIGDVTPLDLAVFRDNGTVYVGIRVGAGAELAPRAQLGSVPYAAFAQHSAAVPFAGITGAPAHVTTGYTGGAGVTVTGTTVSIDTTTVQSRITATCPAGQAIRAIAADGTVTCQSTGGGAYTAGAGLALTGTTFSVAPNAVTAAMQAYPHGTRMGFFPNAPTATCSQPAVGGNTFGSTTATTSQYIAQMFYDESASDTGLRADYTRGRLQVQCRGAGVIELVSECTTVLATITCTGGARPWTASSAEFALGAGIGVNIRVRATSGTFEWAQPELIMY